MSCEYYFAAFLVLKAVSNTPLIALATSSLLITALQTTVTEFEATTNFLLLIFISGGMGWCYLANEEASDRLARAKLGICLIQ